MMAVHRRLGALVRVAADGRGEHTGARVRGMEGTIIDRGGEPGWYFVRFDGPDGVLLADWVHGDALLDPES